MRSAGVALKVNFSSGIALAILSIVSFKPVQSFNISAWMDTDWAAGLSGATSMMAPATASVGAHVS